MLKDKIANFITVLLVILTCLIVEVEPEIQINCMCRDAQCLMGVVSAKALIFNIFNIFVKLGYYFERFTAVDATILGYKGLAGYPHA